jgi:prepilin-type N-terminal cleavage/methylation domain-containing protein
MSVGTKKALIRESSAQRGLTLVELMVSVAIAAILASAAANLMRDYTSTAKTLRVAADANVVMLSLLRDIRKSFQASSPDNSRDRGCVLKFVGAAGQTNNIANYTCDLRAVGQGSAPKPKVLTDGIGFNINVDKPTVAFVNACEKIPKVFPYAAGRAGKLTEPPPALADVKNWGGLEKTCPAACPDGERPVIKFLTSASGEVVGRQVPPSLSGGNLYLWGATICASYYRDMVRREQRLFGDNVGAFEPAYLDVNAFIARGRFDIRKRFDPSGKPLGSLYVWNHGGLHLEFNEAQEMHTFKD